MAGIMAAEASRRSWTPAAELQLLAALLLELGLCTIAPMRAVDRDLWVAEQPLRFGMLELGTRMTVMRLKDSSLVLYSPITRIGSSKAHFTPLDVHDVYSRGEIRALDNRPGSVGGRALLGRRTRRGIESGRVLAVGKRLRAKPASA